MKSFHTNTETREMPKKGWVFRNMLTLFSVRGGRLPSQEARFLARFFEYKPDPEEMMYDVVC